MNLLNKILYSVMMLLVSASALRAQDCKSVLNVITDNDSARIFINGKLSGIGKTELELEKGTYIIKASEPPPVWNAKTVVDTVLLSGCNKTRVIHLLFSGYRYLNTSPQDAAVFNHDSLIGYTPLFVTTGLLNAEIKKNGFADKKILITELPYDKTIDLKFTGVPGTKKFFKKDIFKYLVGGIIILGSTAAYFKLKADNRFNDYQATGSLAKLDETRKYDLISGITLGGLEINFGILIYYFLTD